jgi:hypothetical protein
MKLPSLASIDQSIGGRPEMCHQKKTRLSFYLSPEETVILKAYIKGSDSTVSGLVRSLLKPLLK